MHTGADPAFAATGFRGPLVIDDLLFAAAKANRVAPLQLLRADRVVGVDHIAQAALQADRAIAAGRAVADRPELELLRFAAGQKSIRRALMHLGLDAGGDAVVVALGDKAVDAVDYFLHQAGHRSDDAILTEDLAARAVAFGIDPARLTATSPGLASDLVLEAVAAVAVAR